MPDNTGQSSVGPDETRLTELGSATELTSTEKALFVRPHYNQEGLIMIRQPYDERIDRGREKVGRENSQAPIQGEGGSPNGTRTESSSGLKEQGSQGDTPEITAAREALPDHQDKVFEVEHEDGSTETGTAADLMAKADEEAVLAEQSDLTTNSVITCFLRFYSINPQKNVLTTIDITPAINMPSIHLISANCPSCSACFTFTS